MNWTPEQLAEHYKEVPAYRNMPVEPPARPIKRHKFNARKTEVDGITFDSAAEAKAYSTLKLLLAVGEITELERQPRFVLQEGFGRNGKKYRAITYVADFEFVRDGERIIVDVKGMPTPVFLLKEKLFRYKYPNLKLEIWK